MNNNFDLSGFYKKIKTTIVIISTFLLICSNLRAQNQELERVLKEIKTLVESKEIQGFTAGKMTFNPCRFDFDYDLKNETVEVSRVQIPKDGKKDLSMDKELRTVQLKSLNKDLINFDSNSVKMLSLNIPVKEGEMVNVDSFKDGEKYNNKLPFLSIGPYKFKKHKKYLKTLKQLFYQAIELAES